MIDRYSEYNITVYDLNRCISFCRDRLGLEMRRHEKEYAYFAFGRSGQGLPPISVSTANTLFQDSKFPVSGELTHHAFRPMALYDVDNDCRGFSVRRVFLYFLPPSFLSGRPFPSSETYKGTSGKSTSLLRSSWSGHPIAVYQKLQILAKVAPMLVLWFKFEYD